MAARGVQGLASAGRRAARMAQGGTDRHHVRLRLAGRASGAGRAAARGVDRLGRGRRTDDRVQRAAQHARRDAPGRHRGARARVRAGRPRADRAPGARRGVRRPGARPGHAGRRHVPAGGRAAGSGPADGQGGDDRRDVRADDRARRPGRAADAGRLPGRDGLPRLGGPRRPRGPGPAHLRRAACSDVRRQRVRCPDGSARALRAQRAHPGRCGGAVQDVGRHDARPGCLDRRADRVVPAR